MGRRSIGFALDHAVPAVRFAKGACKEDVARP